MKDEKECLVLMFPENQKDAHILQREVLKNYDCKIETIITTPALLERLSEGGVRGLFCSLKHFDLPFLNILGKAQTLCKEMFTVVLSDSADKRVLDYLRRFDKIIYLEKPMPLTAIAIICEKVIKGSVLFERKHRRFSTNQLATMELLGANKTISVRVYNMSRGGAYLELESGEVQVKEPVKLILQLDQIGKERVVHGKVAWTLKTGFHNGKFGVGLEFVNSAEAYLSIFDGG